MYRIPFLIVMFVILVAALPASVQADIPNMLAWQGVALDSTNAPLTDGDYTFHFAIYNSAAAGDSLWGESQLIPVVDGVVSAKLGIIVALPDTLFDEPTRFLQVQFENEAPYTPRTQIVSVGYAHRVASINGAGGGTVFGNVSIQSDLDLDGDMRVTGKGTIGPGHDNLGPFGFVAGVTNYADGIAAAVGGGESNEIMGDFATIGGGFDNTARDSGSAIAGGRQNIADFPVASVGGGHWNWARAHHATIPGGWFNQATDSGATVGGGRNNTADGIHTTVGGGEANHAGPERNATVAGGVDNSALRQFSFVGGGINNLAADYAAVVVGGAINRAESTYATVGGGWTNVAGAPEATVSGGSTNEALSWRATIGGGAGNLATDTGVTIGGGSGNSAGGAHSTIGGGRSNQAGSNDFATVGGGFNNWAQSTYSTVGGGTNNDNTGYAGVIAGGHTNSVGQSYSTVGGGFDNIVNGAYSAIPGGNHNRASQHYTFAAGTKAEAVHPGAVVLSADSSANTGTWVRSGGDEQMVLRADGRFYLTSTNGTAAFDTSRFLNTSTGAYITNSGQFVEASDRNLKENFSEVDGEELLKRIAALPVTEWNYRVDPDHNRHVGPMAQDFYELFSLGYDDKSIAPHDMAGLALVAIQELYRKSQEMDELKRQIEELRRRIDEEARP